MSYPIPKFVYNPGGGDITLSPTYPPVNKEPVNALEAVRHDSITTSGIQQSVTERVDQVQHLEFKTVPQSDLAAWAAFMKWAVAGGLFYYYPDGTLTGNNGFLLIDTGWSPKRVFFQTYSFNIAMRQVLPAVSHP